MVDMTLANIEGVLMWRCTCSPQPDIDPVVSFGATRKQAVKNCKRTIKIDMARAKPPTKKDFAKAIKNS